MAYTRTNWISEETALSAANMNNIEDGIEEAKADIEEAKADIEIDPTTISIYTNLGWEAPTP